MVEDKMSMSFSELHNISHIQHQQDVQSRSLNEDEFIREIDEIKEEDYEGMIMFITLFQINLTLFR